MAPEAKDILTPTQLNRAVRTLLESHFHFVWVEGELSNFARPSSGHWYFTLKDDRAQVRCAMFRASNQRLRFTPENGDQVRLRARVSLYEGRGDFQLIGEFMEPAGAGTLQAQFEALRDRLRGEGLFDSALKQPLPEHVDHLALVTSPTGAALQDMLHVLQRRNPAIRITVIPVPVQGGAAAAKLVEAIALANDLAAHSADCDFDAVILARGGGSLEDLWAFNDEHLARVIAASELPVVTGIGHEVDFTIADFAADARAPTPSAAAELLSLDRAELLQQLRVSEGRLRRAVQSTIAQLQHRLATSRARLRHPGDRLRESAQRLDGYELRLNAAVRALLRDRQQQLALCRQRLSGASPAAQVEASRLKLEQRHNRLQAAVDKRLRALRGSLEQNQARLGSLSPLSVLARGYAIVSKASGEVLRDPADAADRELLSVRLAAGSLPVRAVKGAGKSEGKKPKEKGD